MAAITHPNDLRFPPEMSALIAAEIEIVAWNETDLLDDIPETDPDAMYLAAHFMPTRPRTRGKTVTTFRTVTCHTESSTSRARR